MEIKGIAKGDKDLRHFTFDDGDYVVRGGIYYYKVNYGKNALEGEYGEDEIGYVECDRVIPLGGKKPKPIQGRKVEEQPAKKEVVETKAPAKRGRPPKVKKEEVPKETIPMVVEGGAWKFEYYVSYLDAESKDGLEDELNKLGDSGWELCGFDTNRGVFGSMKIVAVFKRRRG